MIEFSGNFVGRKESRGRMRRGSKDRLLQFKTPFARRHGSQPRRDASPVVFKAHRLVYHSTLGWRVIIKKMLLPVAQLPCAIERTNRAILAST